MQTSALARRAAARDVRVAAKKAAGTKTTKAAAPRRSSGSSSGDAQWLPNTPRPEWLDGSLPGDRGFDPLGLAKPTEYIQIGIDQLDQNKAVNKAGQVVGAFKGGEGRVDASTSLQPYDDVFSLARFRENELIHGRWAMLAALGVLVAEGATGISWNDATKLELEKASYLGLDLPFSTTALAYINPILIGGAELYRNTATDPEERCYPGGVFDPLNLGSGDADKVFKLREAELKHGRLAMVACLGFGVQALAQGEGALGSIRKYVGTA